MYRKTHYYSRPVSHFCSLLSSFCFLIPSPSLVDFSSCFIFFALLILRLGGYCEITVLLTNWIVILFHWTIIPWKWEGNSVTKMVQEVCLRLCLQCVREIVLEPISFTSEVRVIVGIIWSLNYYMYHIQYEFMHTIFSYELPDCVKWVFWFKSFLWTVLKCFLWQWSWVIWFM